MALLEIKGITKNFGGILAVKDIDLRVEEGKITGLIGPNGSGKTTLFNIISGFLKQDTGNITFDGEPFDHLHTYDRARKGLVRTFQHTDIFKAMTVEDNLLVGMHLKTRVSLQHIFIFRNVKKHEEADSLEKAEELMNIFDLDKRRYEKAGTLSPREQRILEIARALASDPRLLMLDEPFGGLNPNECESLRKKLEMVSRKGITILLIEHNMHVIMNMCDQISVLNYGRKISEGSPDNVKFDPNVIKAYLGSWE